MRRLSGGNQQKVTIARWVAGGVRTMLCFDPTRGIDIGTKQRDLPLLRELAEAGTSVLFYTSDSRRCSSSATARSSSSAGGSWPRSPSRRPTSRRSCGPPTACRPTRHGRGSRRLELAAEAECRDRRRPRRRHEGRSATGVDRVVTRDGAIQSIALGPEPRRRDGLRSASSAVLFVMLGFTKVIQPSYGPALGSGDRRAALCFRRVAQTVVVIAGGIDLSVASIMALTSVTAAVADEGPGEGAPSSSSSRPPAGIALGALNGSLIVVTRVPDIVVTLAMSFVWAGRAVGARLAGRRLRGLAEGARHRVVLESTWMPRAFCCSRHRAGHLDSAAALDARPVHLRHRLERAGRLPQRRPVGRTRIVAYALGRALRGVGRPGLTVAPASVAHPRPLPLQSVAAVVLGGVSLGGGRGGLLGPIVAVLSCGWCAPT